ncbi:MAG: carbohydrate-binding family 9-like protein, partial [Bacteroidota bacterium]
SQSIFTRDTTLLYFFAELEEPHVWASLKQRDTIIFHNNDFEVFIDPDGDTHNYFELEVNAFNTVWDLFLTRPYRNGTNVLDAWDIPGLQTAVDIQGTLNDPRDRDSGWSVEIAIPWEVLLEGNASKRIPVNQYWRINFSRVNWDFDLVAGKYIRKKDALGKYLPEYNWVWSPQWTINMHKPEYWGYVFFSPNPPGMDTTFTIAEDESLKLYLFQLHENLRMGTKGRNGLKEGAKVLVNTEEKEIAGKTITPQLDIHSFGWTLWVKSPFTGSILYIEETGKFGCVDQN